MKTTSFQDKIAQCMRFKNTVPFSQSLNNWIEREFAKLKYEVRFVDCEPYSGFAEMQDHANSTNILYISMLHSDNTIFGNPEVNWKFRAIHDAFHIEHNLSFSAEHELLVNYLQLQYASKELNQFDLQLLNIETAGQILYYVQNDDFPQDQRAFAITELQKCYPNV